MTKLFKKISAPLISLIFLLSMSSAGMAETTVSAEVGFILTAGRCSAAVVAQVPAVAPRC